MPWEKSKGADASPQAIARRIEAWIREQGALGQVQ